jgi:hypothetical protein
MLIEIVALLNNNSVEISFILEISSFNPIFKVFSKLMQIIFDNLQCYAFFIQLLYDSEYIKK